MKVILLTLGSSGDVHPFVGIGLALQARGHDVVVVTSRHFGDAATRAGLRLRPIETTADFESVLTNPDVWHPLRGTWLVFDVVLDSLRAVYDAVAAEVTDDAVLVASSLGFAGRIAQEKFGIPAVTVHLSPAQFRSSIKPPKLPGLFMPRWLPRAIKQRIWDGGDRFVLDPRLGPRLNGFRDELGMPPVTKIIDTWWNSPDRVIGLFPDWFAPPQPDWPPQTVLTGFPRFDESDQHEIDPAVERFLEDGDQPILFTPGSAMRHGHRFFATAVETCGRLNYRGLLLTRHADQLPPNLPSTMLHVPYVPFSRVFPRVAAVVHHGGIGTTAQALAAGVPQLVTPFAHDQFDNGLRVQQLGVGRMLPAKRFTPNRAAAALADILNRSNQAATIARRFDADDSLARTCDVIESLSSEPLAGARRPTYASRISTDVLPPAAPKVGDSDPVPDS